MASHHKGGRPRSEMIYNRCRAQHDQSKAKAF